MNTNEHLEFFARDGLRTLCIAKKVSITVNIPCYFYLSPKIVADNTPNPPLGFERILKQITHTGISIIKPITSLQLTSHTHYLLYFLNFQNKTLFSKSLFRELCSVNADLNKWYVLFELISQKIDFGKLL